MVKDLVYVFLMHFPPILQAGLFREGREIWRDIRSYFKDQWNVLDDLGLLCVFIGMVFRWDDCRSEWGPAFYALSAPLLVSRVLFFAQILSFQGPMIQARVSFVGE